MKLEDHIKFISLDENGNLEMEITSEGQEILEELRKKKGLNSINDIFIEMITKAVYLKGKKENADRKGKN